MFGGVGVQVAKGRTTKGLEKPQRPLRVEGLKGLGLGVGKLRQPAL